MRKSRPECNIMLIRAYISSADQIVKCSGNKGVKSERNLIISYQRRSRSCSAYFPIFKLIHFFPSTYACISNHSVVFPVFVRSKNDGNGEAQENTNFIF